MNAADSLPIEATAQLWRAMLGQMLHSGFDEMAKAISRRYVLHRYGKFRVNADLCEKAIEGRLNNSLPKMPRSAYTIRELQELCEYWNSSAPGLLLDWLGSGHTKAELDARVIERGEDIRRNGLGQSRAAMNSVRLGRIAA